MDDFQEKTIHYGCRWPEMIRHFNVTALHISGTLPGSEVRWPSWRLYTQPVCPAADTLWPHLPMYSTTVAYHNLHLLIFLSVTIYCKNGHDCNGNAAFYWCPKKVAAEFWYSTKALQMCSVWWQIIKWNSPEMMRLWELVFYRLPKMTGTNLRMMPLLLAWYILQKILFGPPIMCPSGI